MIAQLAAQKTRNSNALGEKDPLKLGSTISNTLTYKAGH